MSQLGDDVVLVQPSAYPTNMYASAQLPGDLMQVSEYGLGADRSGLGRFFCFSEHLIGEADDYGGKNKRTGRSLTAPFAHRWRVTDRKITGFTQYTDTAKVR